MYPLSSFLIDFEPPTFLAIYIAQDCVDIVILHFFDLP